MDMETVQNDWWRGKERKTESKLMGGVKNLFDSKISSLFLTTCQTKSNSPVTLVATNKIFNDNGFCSGIYLRSYFSKGNGEYQIHPKQSEIV